MTLSNGDVIKFSGWNFTSDSGYGVLTDLRIEPLFEYELYSGTSDRATISMDLSGSDYISIGEKTISALKSSGNALEVKIKGGLITLDTTAVSSLEGREYKVNVNSIPVDVLPEKLYEELSDSELFEIDFGGQHNFGGGTLSISLYYNVPDGKNSSDLVVYHIENGEKNIVQSKYSDGRITFDVSGLSYFAVTYNPSNDENSSIMQYATIVIVVILVFGTAIIAMRHIKQTNRSY